MRWSHAAFFAALATTACLTGCDSEDSSSTPDGSTLVRTETPDPHRIPMDLPGYQALPSKELLYLVPEASGVSVVTDEGISKTDDEGATFRNQRLPKVGENITFSAYESNFIFRSLAGLFYSTLHDLGNLNLERRLMLANSSGDQTFGTMPVNGANYSFGANTICSVNFAFTYSTDGYAECSRDGYQSRFRIEFAPLGKTLLELAPVNGFDGRVRYASATGFYEYDETAGKWNIRAKSLPIPAKNSYMMYRLPNGNYLASWASLEKLRKENPWFLLDSNLDPIGEATVDKDPADGYIEDVITIGNDIYATTRPLVRGWSDDDFYRGKQYSRRSLLKSTDGGKSWSLVLTARDLYLNPSGTVYSIERGEFKVSSVISPRNDLIKVPNSYRFTYTYGFAADDSGAILARTTELGSIMISKDGGLTAKSKPSLEYINFAISVGSGKFLVRRGAEFSISDVEGDHSIAAPPLSSDAWSYYDVARTDPAGGAWLSTKSGILHFDARTEKWNLVPYPRDSQINEIVHFLPRPNGFLLVYRGKAYFLSKEGALEERAKIDSASNELGCWSSVDSPRYGILLLCESTQGALGLYRSMDEGRNFSETDFSYAPQKPYPSRYSQLLVNNEGTVFLTTEQGTLELNSAGLAWENACTTAISASKPWRCWEQRIGSPVTLKSGTYFTRIGCAANGECSLYPSQDEQFGPLYFVKDF